MNGLEKLTDEIKFQLESDLLSYEWLLGIARRHFPNESFENQASWIVESVVAIHGEGKISVGDAKRCDDGKVRIIPWTDDTGELQASLRNCVKEVGRPSSSVDGFWIGLLSEN